MAATTACLALSSAARQLSRSASTIFMREVSGSHKVTIDGYSASKIPLDQLAPVWWCATSQPFEAVGYTWRISSYFLNGFGKEAGGGDDNDCISLDLELADEDDYDDEHEFSGNHFHHLHNHPVPVRLELSLLDLAGTPVPGYTRSTEGCVFWRQPTMPVSASIGFHDFVKWKDLHESGALKEGRFAIRCDITAINDCSDEPDSDGDDGGGAPQSAVVVPPSNLHQQLSDLLWKQKHGADVAIDVAGETFDAHGWLLAARSPVFKAELQALTTVTSSKKEKEPPSGAAARRTMKIKDMDPKVFKAMLHFMYTDTLPQDEQDGDGEGGVGVEMAWGLLAAADRYKLERLKLMCEETLCKRIDVDTVAAILVAAEEHRCQALKASCVALFMARPGCMKAVMETRGFEEVKATCLPLLLEILIKQLA